MVFFSPETKLGSKITAAFATAAASAEQHIRAEGCSAVLVYPTADILSTVRVFPGISTLHSNTLTVRKCELEEVLRHCGIRPRLCGPCEAIRNRRKSCEPPPHCIAMIMVGMTSEYYDRDRMLLLGGFFGAFASISSACNCLASHGLCTWRRGFLVPWLMFYLILICLLFMVLAHSLFFQNLQLKQVFLFFMCVAMFSCWRHMHRQFLLMLHPRPEQVVVDVELLCGTT